MGFRKDVFSFDELCTMEDKTYNKYKKWITEHREDLERQIYEGPCIHGEWLDDNRCVKGYRNAGFDKQVYLFSKSRIVWDYNGDGKMRVERMNYDLDTLKYVFADGEIPDYLGIVSVVAHCYQVPSKKVLDSYYEEYTQKVGRDVEGLVASRNGVTEKYLRVEKGKKVEYDENRHKSQQ